MYVLPILRNPISSQLIVKVLETHIVILPVLNKIGPMQVLSRVHLIKSFSVWSNYLFIGSHIGPSRTSFINFRSLFVVCFHMSGLHMLLCATAGGCLYVL